MIFPQDLFIALAILVGLIGAIIQIIPGGFIVLGAILMWAILTGGAAAWWIFAAAAVVTFGGIGLKFLVAGRHLHRSTVRNSSILIGLVAGAVGFFVIPVLGLPLGFIGGVFVCEYIREQQLDAAWRSTVVALKATGLTILVELCAALVATALWIVGLIIT